MARPVFITIMLLACALPASAQERHRGWIASRYEYTHLDDDSGPWHNGSLEVGRRGTRLTPIARLNYASRLGNEGFQAEADLYPAVPGLGYAYLSAAFSNGIPFPDLRLAGELFATLPAAFEASAGVIHMDFATSDVSIFVASVSRYTGNYWIALRPSWTDVGSELAVSLIGRRYLRTPGEFVTLRLTAGSTPEEIARGTSLESFGLQADAQIEIGPRWLLLPLASVAREELNGADDGAARLRASVGIGGMYRL